MQDEESTPQYPAKTLFPTPEEAFSYWQREFRESHEPKLSQAALGQKVGLDSTAITKIERGTRSIRLNDAVSIASALGQDLAMMITSPAEYTLRHQVEALKGQRDFYREKVEEETRVMGVLDEMIVRLEQQIIEEEGGGRPVEH